MRPGRCASSWTIPRQAAREPGGPRALGEIHGPARVRGAPGGPRAGAAAVLDRLAALEPGFGVDEMQYPPSFRREADQARRRVASQPKARLTVRSGERRATAFVDGKPVGPTPAAVALPPGRYRARRQGRRRAGAFHIRPAGGRRPHRRAPTTSRWPERSGWDAGPCLALPIAQRAAALVRAGGWLGATRLVAVSEVAEDEARFLDGALYDVQRGALVREGRVRMAAARCRPPSWARWPRSSSPDSRGAAWRRSTPSPPPPRQRSAAPRRTPRARPRSRRPGRDGRPAAARVDAPGCHGAGAVALGLAGVATWQGLSARSSYRDADAMLRSDGVLQPGISQPARDAALASADSAKRNAYLAAVARCSRRHRLLLCYLSWDERGAPVVRF